MKSNVKVTVNSSLGNLFPFYVLASAPVNKLNLICSFVHCSLQETRNKSKKLVSKTAEQFG